MTLQYSVAVRNARLDVVESTTGASAILKIRSGAPPASCTTADSGTVLATLALPADYMAPASGGTKAVGQRDNAVTASERANRITAEKSGNRLHANEPARRIEMNPTRRAA